MNCKHKYQPRYSRKWSTAIKDVLATLNGKFSGKVINPDPYLQEETYIHDICVKCGDIRK